MRIELYIFGAQIVDFIITKEPKKDKIGFKLKGKQNEKDSH